MSGQRHTARGVEGLHRLDERSRCVSGIRSTISAISARRRSVTGSTTRRPIAVKDRIDSRRRSSGLRGRSSQHCWGVRPRASQPKDLRPVARQAGSVAGPTRARTTSARNCGRDGESSTSSREHAATAVSDRDAVSPTSGDPVDVVDGLRGVSGCPPAEVPARARSTCTANEPNATTLVRLRVGWTERQTPSWHHL